MKSDFSDVPKAAQYATSYQLFINLVIRVKLAYLDFCTLAGSYFIAISVQNQAAFLDPDLVLASWFGITAAAKYVI